MFDPYKYTQRPTTKEVSKIHITAIIREFFNEIEIKFGEGRRMNLCVKTEGEAEKVKNEINNNFYGYECLYVPQHDTALRIDYEKSNLGVGYYFYFVCKCERRVLYLYQLSETSELNCRKCLRLKYKKPDNRKSKIRRLIRNPDILMNYLNSTPKHYEIAAEALNTLKELRANNLL